MRQNILDELEFELRIDAAEIGVAVDNGIVTLTGHVRTYTEKEAAERVARRVKGVRGIAQEIEVRIFGAKETDDDDIAIPKEAVQGRGSRARSMVGAGGHHAR